MAPDAAAPMASPRWADTYASLPRGSEQNARVCARGGDDRVRDVFCGDTPLNVASISELRDALQITAAPYSPGARGGATVISGVSMVGHTTSLSTRSVSAINPRVIQVRLDIQPSDLTALAFARGEQIAELVAQDRVRNEFQFYVVSFKQECNDSATGCVPGDLFTPAIEDGWSDVTLYDETDLANTVVDCATCHQPSGPGTAKLLLMRELENPWTHWFFPNAAGGRALIDDYVSAKGDEALAGVESEKLLLSTPSTVEQFTRFGNPMQQPMMFDSRAIENEVSASSGDQPVDNSVPGTSATWSAMFERAQSGDEVAVPYHDVKVTDAAKLERASEAYRAFRAGEIEREALPDLRDVFPDDEQLLAEMGMMTTAGASGEAVLLQACSQCHNPRLDQTVSRALFRADLEGLSREVKERAIRRLQLPASDPGVMPPPRLRVLSADARARAIEVLQR